MDARAAAHFVFGMCQDVDNHAFIMKDSTVLSSIQGFLRSNDPECMRKAMKSLNLLSNNPLNIKKLKTGALLALLAELSEHDDAIINQTASMILDNLNDSVNAGLDDFEGAPAASAAEAAVAATAAAAPPAVMVPASTTKKSATYLNTIPFTVASLKGSASQGAVLEKMLVKQAGVVSVSVDTAHNRITVYSNVFVKDQCAPLLAALDAAGFPACVEGAPMAAAAKENGSKSVNKDSGYLDAAQFAGVSGPRKGSLAMAVYQDVNADASLTARLARKQEEKKKEEQSQKSLVGRLTSWFW